VIAKLDRRQALLAVIDVQEKLMNVIDGAAELRKNLERLIRGAAILGVPAVLTEQYPQGIGPTVDSVREAFEQSSRYEPIQKMCFSSWGCNDFADRIRASGRHQIIIAGIEAHVCVYQTVLDLLAEKYDVHVVADAVSSRTARNREIALARMASEGARLTSTEMALFELTVNAGSDEFRAISKLVK
jgi:nicotinamidase-related amidase